MSKEQLDLLERESATRWVEDQLLGTEPSDEPVIKVVTVPLEAGSIEAADRLADALGISRRKLLAKCVSLGLQEVHEAMQEFNEHHVTGSIEV